MSYYNKLREKTEIVIKYLRLEYYMKKAVKNKMTKVSDLKEIRRVLEELNRRKGIDLEVIVRYINQKTKIPLRTIKKIFKESEKFLPEIVAENV